MKTAREFAEEWSEQDDEGEIVQLMYAVLERDEDLRRLVEEAQGERDGAVTDNFRLMAERDRLTGELAEIDKQVDALEGLIDTERQVRKEAENTLFFVRKDLQKREGELAEARHDLEYYRRNFPGHSIPRPVAATPAEQAQPTYEDGEGKPAKQLNAERLISSTPIKAAEQAQGEVANCGRPGPGCMESAQVAALAKRVDALTARLDRIAAPPPRPFVSEVKRHWDDPSVRDNFVDATLDDHEARLRDLEWRFKTTDPRAAGPGHAFVPGGGDFGKIVGGKLVACDGYGNNVCACGLLELDPIHAVPPIAGSAKP